MPPITAILHTCNDGLRLGRALESLRVCDELLVVDHGSTDHTLRVAREYAAKIHSISGNLSLEKTLLMARYPWFLVILPSESISEGLEASLLEWKRRSQTEVAQIPACSVVLREEGAEGWRENHQVTRLVRKGWNAWDGHLPRHDPGSVLLEGELLRFRRP